jgi:hypothetical protein
VGLRLLDETTVVAVFGDGFLAVPPFFVPSDSLRRCSERDGVPYVLTLLVKLAAAG